FLLDTAAGSVLVDGGRSPASLPRLFARFVDRTYVDVLIVTHNDGDHANGVLGFLRSDLDAGELWLPARFLAALPQIVVRPWETVVETLVEQVAAVPDELLRTSLTDPGRPPGRGRVAGDGLGAARETEEPPPSLLERYAESDETLIRAEEVLAALAHPTWWDLPWAGETLEPRPETLGWPEELLPALDALSLSASWDPFWTRADTEDAFEVIVHRRLSRRRWMFALGAIVAARRIRHIAQTAFDRGIPVRWFEHAPGAPSGGLPWLQPLSAREVFRVRVARQGELLFALALTTVNRESLVFWAPPDGVHGGVLFTSDADLQGLAPPRSLATAVVTAPHHGSVHNRQAYAVLPPPAWWVRSDARVRFRPCAEYRQAPGRKACTVCRGQSTPKQAVLVIGNSGQWQPDPAVRLCGCT
ncbi:MAG: hypothetical protein NZL87_07830, partial [Thermomicrobium sp.]|nr:hypothetical protein [Thermomicrobium sp.]